MWTFAILTIQPLRQHSTLLPATTLFFVVFMCAQLGISCANAIWANCESGPWGVNTGWSSTRSTEDGHTLVHFIKPFRSHWIVSFLVVFSPSYGRWHPTRTYQVRFLYTFYVREGGGWWGRITHHYVSITHTQILKHNFFGWRQPFEHYRVTYSWLNS